MVVGYAGVVSSENITAKGAKNTKGIFNAKERMVQKGSTWPVRIDKSSRFVNSAALP
jgi:hypothetical protein